ncbi:MAG: hypothetical protein M3O30_14805, partial [Planctomycetota bacterium]|nr:hypothetical protein [Planctomycetota bacterium]
MGQCPQEHVASAGMVGLATQGSSQIPLHHRKDRLCLCSMPICLAVEMRLHPPAVFVAGQKV